MELHLRGRLQPKDSAGTVRRETNNPLEGFKELLAIRDFPQAEPMIEWPKTKSDDFCVLDIDIHGMKLSPERVERDVSNLRFFPDLWWISHGNGVKGAFVQDGIYTARERAALFVAGFLGQRSGRYVDGVEFLTRTRHPAYARGAETCSPVREGGTWGPGIVIDQLLGTADEEAPSAEDVDEWLATAGLERGRRYPHDRCPIEPSPDNGSKRDPVVVLDRGVFCHVCGSRGRSFLPYARLLNPDRMSQVSSPLALAVKHRVHWQHAKYIIAADFDHLPQSAKWTECQELIYRALVRKWHLTPLIDERESAEGRIVWEATKKLIEKVFYPPLKLVRGSGYWVLPEDLATPRDKGGLQLTLANAPAVKFIDEDGNEKTSPVMLGDLLGNRDLADIGYKRIEPVRGVDFGWRDLTCEAPRESDPIRAVVPADPPFRLYPQKEIDLPYVEAVLQRQFPGMRIDVLKFLIACKGLTQTGISEPPRVFLSGQSGSAKTATCQLAAELSCDRFQMLTLVKDPERFKEALGLAVCTSGFIIVDEIGKAAVEAPQMLSMLLDMAKGSTYRILYVGPRRLERLPVVCLTDTTIPSVFYRDDQPARRMVLVNLESGAVGHNWRVTCGGSIEGWRARSADNARVADMLTSWVIHNRASGDFESVVEQCGLKLLLHADTEDGVDRNETKRRFFEAVCQEQDTQNTRFKGQGWKVFDPRDMASPVAGAFRDAMDKGSTFEDPETWQTLNGARWGEFIGVPGIVFDKQVHGKRVGVRFRIGDPRKPNAVYNDEIVAKDAGDSSRQCSRQL